MRLCNLVLNMQALEKYLVYILHPAHSMYGSYEAFISTGSVDTQP